MSVVESLVEMGFPKERAEAAANNSTTLETAIEWLMSHEESSSSNVGGAPAAAAEQETKPSEEPVANSFKCNDCGKLLRDQNAVMFHATKAGHENFEQSTEELKPLTEEEKAKQVADLRDRIKAHRAKKEEDEKKENLEKEKRRREEGKLMVERRDEKQRKEMLALAEERKRAKLEEQQAKQRILEQIRLDKEARKNRDQGHSAEVQQPKPAAAPAPAAPPKNYDETVIQIRLLNGQAVKQTFNAKEPLSMVRAWVSTNHGDGSSFSLMTPFPRKIFTEDDMGNSLSALDLVPSANIVLVRM